MARDDRLLVGFKAQYFDPALKDLLWRELIEHAIERLGADSFSAQMDLLDERLPPEARQARDSLIAHTRLLRPRRSVLPVKPPRWPVDPSTRQWFRDAGPWVYRSTLWRGNDWVLESAPWGKYFSLVVLPDEWSRLQTEKPWLATLQPPPKSEPFRKEDERVRRGWSLSRPVRVLAALAAAVVVAAISSLEEASPWVFSGVFAGIVVYLALPAREPLPLARVVAHTRSPD